MNRLIGVFVCAGIVLAGLSMTAAQPPGGRPGTDGDRPRGDGPPPVPPVFAALDKNGDGELSADELQGAVEALKKLDKNGDGKLSEDELRPERGPQGFGRGDRPEGAGPRERDRGPADRGGREGARDQGRRDDRRDGPGRPDGQGPRGPGGPERGGPEGAGPGGPGRGMPSVVPPFAREQLRLTDAQQKQIDDLDAEVKVRLDKILTAEQKQQLEQMRPRGPGGPGGFGGPPRDGGDRNGPPQGRDRSPRQEGGGRPQRPE